MPQIRMERRSNGVALYKGSNGLTSLTFQVWLLCTRINIDGNTTIGFCSWEISLLHILACFFFLLSFRSNSRTPYKPPHQWNLLTPNKLHWYRKRQKSFLETHQSFIPPQLPQTSRKFPQNFSNTEQATSPRHKSTSPKPKLLHSQDLLPGGRRRRRPCPKRQRWRRRTNSHCVRCDSRRSN